MTPDQIALQLYTVRQHTGQDFVGTLRQVAEMGYRAVELAGLGGLPASEVRAALDELGLRAMGAHVPFARFESDLDGVVAEMQALGCEYAIVPSMPQDRRDDRGRALEAAELFNHWGERCRAAGLRFGYHNHAFEFAPLDGGTLFDLLVANTDPSLVALELDLFWAHDAGVDPVALLGQLGGRVPLVHVKDREAGDERADAPVGDGILPWDRLLEASAAAGAQWYIVEQDHPKNPLDDVRRSLQYLERMAR